MRLKCDWESDVDGNSKSGWESFFEEFWKLSQNDFGLKKASQSDFQII